VKAEDNKFIFLQKNVSDYQYIEIVKKPIKTRARTQKRGMMNLIHLLNPIFTMVSAARMSEVGLIK
jgi:hypothetical protein